MKLTTTIPESVDALLLTLKSKTRRPRSEIFGGGTKRVESLCETHGELTIAFEANFDTDLLTIGEIAIQLDRVNVVVIDNVELAVATGASSRANGTSSYSSRTNLSSGVPLPATPTRTR